MTIIYRDRRMAQLVIDPKTDEDYQYRALLVGAKVMRAQEYSVWTILRAKILKHLHPFIHHFVIWKDFDANSERLIDVGYVCAYCGIGQLGAE